MSDTQQHYERVVLRNQQQEVIQKALDLSRLEQRRLDHNNNNNNNKKRGGSSSSLRRQTTQQAAAAVDDKTTTTKYDLEESTETSNNNNNSESSSSSQQQQPPEDDWPFLGLWFSMMVLSYYRIRVEPHLRRHRRQESSSPGSRLNASEQQEAVVRTLRRINQERQASGQESISLESYQAFQHVLMTGRSIWRVLAQRPEEPQRRRRPVGATQEQLEACPIRTLEERRRRPDNDNDGNGGECVEEEDGECTICLGSYESKQRIRTLPCRYAFHVDCIDRWMQQSVLCPICKASLAPEEEEEETNSNDENVVWANIPGRMNSNNFII